MVQIPQNYVKLQRKFCWSSQRISARKSFQNHINTKPPAKIGKSETPVQICSYTNFLSPHWHERKRGLAELMSTHELGNAWESRLGLGAADQSPAVTPERPLSPSVQLNLNKLSHTLRGVRVWLVWTGRIITVGKKLLKNYVGCPLTPEKRYKCLDIVRKK